MLQELDERRSNNDLHFHNIVVYFIQEALQIFDSRNLIVRRLNIEFDFSPLPLQLIEHLLITQLLTGNIGYLRQILNLAHNIRFNEPLQCPIIVLIQGQMGRLRNSIPMPLSQIRIPQAVDQW